jgi:hypothetical protein
MSEDLKLPTVPEMLRTTGENTAEFMKQVADHILKLEDMIVQLRDRVTELESASGNNTTAQ